MSSSLLILQTLDLAVALLLGLTVWSFCRFYYFAFYVIEQYVDHEYRFAGLGSFLHYVLFRRSGDRSGKT